MKKTILILALFLGSFIAKAQELKWETDIHKAIETSNKTKKPMMLFFTGSDWCGWCIRLQKEVFLTSEFKKWADENVILVELDFPKKTSQSDELKQQNAGIANAFGIQGYPTVIFATAKTNEKGESNFEGIGKTGYVAGGPTTWINVANGFLKKS